MITFDAARDQSINTVIEQIEKENLMKTLLLSFMQKHTSEGLAFRASETRQAAGVEPPSLPVRNNLFRYLAGFVLVGAAASSHDAGAALSNHPGASSALGAVGDA